MVLSYVGKLRSVRMHVSMEYFGQQRPPSLDWRIPEANFSHVLSIYGGHFLDMLFHVAGQPKTVSAVVATQFPTLTLTARGQSFPNETPDGVVAIGRLEDDALFSIQIEGGKRNNAGLQIDITGTEGDLKIWNTKSFGNVEDNILRALAEIEARSRGFRSRPAIREFRLPLWTSASRTWLTFMRRMQVIVSPEHRRHRALERESELIRCLTP